MFDLKPCALQRADFSLLGFLLEPWGIISWAKVTGGREHTRKKRAMEHYLAIKRSEELLQHITTGVGLDHIMLRERSQWQKTIFVRFHLYEMSSINKFMKTRNRLMIGCPGLGDDVGNSGMEFLLGRWNVLKLMGSWCPPLNILTTIDCTL